MGQQQILLLICALVCVAIAVSVGITLFNGAADSSNLEALSADLVHLASRAHRFYVKPRGLGGGGCSFANITIRDLTLDPTNGNGTYSILRTAKSKMTLQGVGNRDADNDGTNCTVHATVYVDSVSVVFVNR